VDVVDELAADASPEERMKLLLEQNVILQLQHLKTHPSVARRLARGDHKLHGWAYDIKSGDVSAYDESENSFVPVEQRYADEVAKVVHDRGCAA